MQKHRLSFSANQTVGKGYGPFDAVISRKFEAITHRFSQVSTVASAFVLRQFFGPFSCIDLIDSLSAHTPLTLSKIKLLASLAGYPCEKGVVTSQGLPCSVKDLLKPPSSVLTMLPELPWGCRLDPQDKNLPGNWPLPAEIFHPGFSTPPAVMSGTSLFRLDERSEINASRISLTEVNTKVKCSFETELGNGA
jgi:hypothetical protein